jgi:tetratricopeptide (TPR) repeat protein
LTAPFAEHDDLHSVPPVVMLQAYAGLVRSKHEEFRPKLNQLVEQFARANPADPIVLGVLARQAASQDTPQSRQQAIGYITAVMQKGPANVDDYTLLANLYIRENRNREAVAILEKARTTYPDFSEIYESLAAQYLLLGDYRNGFAVLKRGLELFPADAKLRTLDKQARSATLDGAAQ